MPSAIDLHTHTTCSDGSESPASLVEMAAQSGAQAISITDHDTTAGLADGRAAAASAGIEFINGVELSAEIPAGTMHILGYYIDDKSKELAAALESLRQARQRRNPEIAARLQGLGLSVTYDEVASLAGNEVVGRPHFARVMVQKGYVAKIKEAFDKYLAKGKPAYVPKQRLNPADCIDLIHGAGGVAVLAHPYQMDLDQSDTLSEIRRLKDMGLDGIEAFYSRLSAEERDWYSGIASGLGLLVTGGSDFHGSYKPDIELVTGLGDLSVPYELLAPIKARASQMAAPTGSENWL